MLFFERDIALYVSTVDTGFTTDNTVKIAVLGGSTLNYKTITQDTYNYKIEENPNRIKEKIITGYSTPEFDFVTYAKPYNDSTNDTTVEKLLLYSLMGNLGTDGPTEFTNQFASTHKLPELFLYISFGVGLGYKISNVIVKQAEYKFEVDKILQVSWKTIGLKLEKINNTTINLPDVYTDYTNISSYVKSKFAKIDLTLDYVLEQYQDMMFLDGTDFINKGTAQNTITNNGATLVTVGDIPAYELNSTNDIIFDNAALFTGSAYPNSGVTDLVFECILYWDGTTISNEFIYSFMANFKLSANSNALTIFGPDGASLQGGIVSPTYVSDILIPNAWNHIAYVHYPQGKMYYCFINAKPTAQHWGYSANYNKTVSASSSFRLGGESGNSFSKGQIAYPSLSWNQDSTKYRLNIYVTNGREPDENTVVKLQGNSLTDLSAYNHTVTGSNAEVNPTNPTYLTSPSPNTGSAGQFNIARSSAWNSTDWSIEVNFWYNRVGGTFTGGTIFDDGVRKIFVQNNRCYCSINGTNVLASDNTNTFYYTEAFPKATWMSIVFERCNGIYFLYINGIFRAGNHINAPIPNTISSTGTATFLYITGGSTMHAYNLHVSDIARYSNTNLIKLQQNANYDTSATGTLPVINGTLKLKNNVQIVSSDTLDTRGTQHLTHYVKDRETELDFTSYMKTGTKGNIELFDTINSNLGYNDDTIYGVNARLGGSEDGSVEVNLSNSLIELPEIKIKDIISSNIKITSKKGELDNDDTTIKYSTQGISNTIYTPEPRKWKITYSDWVIYDKPIGYWDMQGTSVGLDSINGNTSNAGGATLPIYQQSTDSTTPDPYCVSINTDSGNSYIELFTTNSPNWSTLLAADGLTIEFFWKVQSTAGESRSTMLLWGGAADNTCFTVRDAYVGDYTYRFSEGYNIGTYGNAWLPTQNQWYHIVLAITPSQQKMYLDGTLYQTQNNNIVLGSNVLWLGGPLFVEKMSFSHVAVYDKLLPEDRIAFHHSLRNDPNA